MTLHLPKILSWKDWQARDQFYPANILFVATPERFLGLWSRNDMRGEQLHFDENFV